VEWPGKNTGTWHDHALGEKMEFKNISL